MLIDVSERLAITDVFVIATGTNERQVEAIVDAVEETLRTRRHKPIRREGQRDGRWVLLDYGDIVVHVQHAEERVFYALERLWKDCPFIPFTDAAAGVAQRDRGVNQRRVLLLRHGRTHGTPSAASRARPTRRWTRSAGCRPTRSPALVAALRPGPAGQLGRRARHADRGSSSAARRA